eukprot:5253036-Pleurochrysis_carterae.AAC.2
MKIEVWRDVDDYECNTASLGLGLSFRRASKAAMHAFEAQDRHIHVHVHCHTMMIYMCIHDLDPQYATLVARLAQLATAWSDFAKTNPKQAR